MSRFFVYIIVFFCILLVMAGGMAYLLAVVIQRGRHRVRPKVGPFALVTVIAIAFTLTAIAYGYYWGRWELDKNEINLSYDTLPASFDGYTIVHISDFHLSSFYGYEDQLGRVIDSINAVKPDLICFTGDLVSLDTAEVAPLVPWLSRLQARDGIVSVLGNHDFLPYGRQAPDLDSIAAVMTRLERDLLGWTVLNNDHIDIVRGGDTVSVCGCMNQSDDWFRFFHRDQHPPLRKGDLAKAVTGAANFKILLTHDPSQWHHEVMEAQRTDIPLTLAGHTHCGQLRFGSWTPASWFFYEVHGLYYPHSTIAPQGSLSLSLSQSTLYINQGLGCTAPIRIFVPMEITVLRLSAGTL